MRGFGDFQRAQMRSQAPGIAARFSELRQAVDSLERAVSSVDKAKAGEPNHHEITGKLFESSAEQRSSKLAYSVKEVLELVGIGRTALYAAIGAKELRAVKHHRKTLILTKDLETWLEGLPPRRDGDCATRCTHIFEPFRVRQSSSVLVALRDRSLCAYCRPVRRL